VRPLALEYGFQQRDPETIRDAKVANIVTNVSTAVSASVSLPALLFDLDFDGDRGG